MTTISRLFEYHDFSRPTLEAVALAADKQMAAKTYQEYFQSMGISRLTRLHYKGDKPTEVLDIRPKDHDEKEAVFVELPMANSLDPNQIMTVATMAASNPDKRFVAFPNPSRPGRSAGRLSVKQIMGGSLQAETQNHFAEEQNIETVHEVGYSLGALKSTVATVAANFSVTNLVNIEPVIGKRTLSQLGKAFKSSEKQLEYYVRANHLPIYEDARKASGSDVSYILGLLRLSNIATALALREPDFLHTVASALEVQRDCVLHTAWGTDSELSNDARLRNDLAFLRDAFGAARVRQTRLVGAHHALGNDIHLHAALVTQAINR